MRQTLHASHLVPVREAPVWQQDVFGQGGMRYGSRLTALLCLCNAESKFHHYHSWLLESVPGTVQCWERKKATPCWQIIV